MKKIVVLFYLLILAVSLCSCKTVIIQHDSITEYVARIEGSNHGFGYSELEIDAAPYLLPSKTFITEYKYEAGEYHYYEEIDNAHNEPYISFLRLEYDELMYVKAKDFMLVNIPQYNDQIYKYNDYVFYQNGNFASHNLQYGYDGFGRWFTMACYNDAKQELVFIGFYAIGAIELTQQTWCDFIDKYYGQYHDFSK